MSTEPGETFWEPSVSVVGVGRRGSGIVGAIDTATAANIQTILSGTEAVSVADEVSDYDFCFLTGDLRETSVPDWVSTVLSSSESRTICLLSGTTDRPGELLESTNLLVPIRDEVWSESEQLVSSTVADFFECMLPPMVENLGYGDIILSTGSARIASLSVEVDSQIETILTRGTSIDSPDSVLLFRCAGERASRDEMYRLGQRASSRYEDTPVLWDQRIHPRYQDKSHVKRFLIAEAEREEREQLLRK
ncbi:hypothetical protein [Salinigranum halophilum]|uniref:hypothetical protein n=1 Tax=Salinigranum halophilum TaxID=2565931 RepID=UPI00115C8C3E|nr:hypothetical protein [Salinigranum halophilum]